MPSSDSLIREIGYDAPNTKLLVKFESGEEFLFVGVPPAVHRALQDAPSLAQYFGERIMDSYPYNILGAG